MLFKVHYEKDFHELNPEASAIPEFANLTSRQMMAVALIADYESPFRTLPEKERREKAAKAAGYNLEKDGKRLDINGRNVVDKKVATIEQAINAYRDMQYNEQRAMLEAIDAQIQETMEIMKMPKTEVVKKTINKGESVIKEYYTPIELAEKAMKLGKGLAELKETKQKLEESVRRDKDVTLNIATSDTIAEVLDDSEQPLSTLDIVMASKIKNHDA
jgi:hypothetical protein